MRTVCIVCQLALCISLACVFASPSLAASSEGADPASAVAKPVAPLIINWDGTASEFIREAGTLPEYLKCRPSLGMLGCSGQRTVNAITTMSEDGAVQLVWLTPILVHEVLDRYSFHTVPVRFTYPEQASSVKYRDAHVYMPKTMTPVIVYNMPDRGKADVILLLSDGDAFTGPAMIADSACYYSTVITKAKYETIFTDLRLSSAGDNQLVVEFYGEQYYKTLAARAAASELHKNDPNWFIGGSFRSPGDPHYVILKIATQAGLADLCESLTALTPIFPSTYNIRLNDGQAGNAVLALSPSRLYAMYETHVQAGADRITADQVSTAITQTELTTEELTSKLTAWESVVVWAFALTDGRVQLLFFEGIAPG